MCIRRSLKPRAGLRRVPSGKKWGSGASDCTEKHRFPLRCGTQRGGAEAPKGKSNSLKYDMGKGSGNRQGAVTRALFFSVPQECAAITKWWSIRGWDYPNKQVVPKRDNAVFAGLGQGNIACELVRCTKYWAQGRACDLIFREVGSIIFYRLL